MGFLGGGPSNNQKQGNNLLNYNAQAATPMSQNATNQGNAAIATGNKELGTGMNFLHQFSSTLGAPTNYFQSLLSGNQANTTQALAPNIDQIRGQTQQALQSTSALAPRGGGRSSTLFNLPMQGTSQASGLFNTVRPQAAQALTGIAGEEGQVGLGTGALGAGLINTGGGLLNTGVNALQAGTNAALGLDNSAATQRQQQQQAGEALGGGIFNLLTGGLGDIITGAKGLPGLFGAGG